MSTFPSNRRVDNDAPAQSGPRRTRFLTHRSIATKLFIHTSVAVAASLILCFAAFIASDAAASRAARTEQMTALASVLGENTRSALEFDDPSAAAITLSSLAKQPTIDFAILYDRHGRVFANYPAAVSASMMAASSDVMAEYWIHSAAVDSGLFDDEFNVLPNPLAEGVEPSLLAGSDLAGRLELHANMHNIRSQIVQRATLATLVFLASLVIGVAVSMYLQSAITAPIRELADASQHIADSQDYSIRVVKRSEDEIGVLADAFNSMVTKVQATGYELQKTNSQLEQRVNQRTAELAKSNDDLQREMAERETLQSELVSTSRQAGMAEVATGVLHNVGNVLNSVNVSANILVEKLRQSRVSSLNKASEVICQQADLATFLTQDERGKQFPTFLHTLASALTDERDVELLELASLVANIEHIKEIVTMQQTFARCRGAEEPVQLDSLVEDALKIAHAGFSGPGVEIERHFQNLPAIVTERHKLLQILINLLSNAKHALDDSDQQRKCVTLSLGDDEDSLFVEVRDNGKGIPSEHLTKIFSHGFTTKKQGHGFGLHSSALAAQELGGSLTAFSTGPGQGAIFTLRLPLHNNRST